MTHIKKNDHFWTYIPELGQDWEYCDRCEKARKDGEGRLYTMKQALKIVEQEKETPKMNVNSKTIRWIINGIKKEISRGHRDSQIELGLTGDLKLERSEAVELIALAHGEMDQARTSELAENVKINIRYYLRVRDYVVNTPMLDTQLHQSLVRLAIEKLDALEHEYKELTGDRFFHWYELPENSDEPEDADLDQETELVQSIENEIESGRYDDDPDPYSGTYSEE